MLETDPVPESEPPSYIDAHTHAWTDDDGIIRVHNIFPDSPDMEKLPRRFCIGIHPDNIDESLVGTQMETIRNILNTSPNAIGVGECGLDHFSGHSMEFQESLFEQQVRLAVEYDLPVIIHAVRTWPDIIRFKNKYDPENLWLAHGFRSSPECAEDLIRHQIMPSFGAALLEDEHNRQVFAEIPDDRFLLETDETAVDIQKIYRTAAEIRMVETDELRRLTMQNFKRVFCRKDRK